NVGVIEVFLGIVFFRNLDDSASSHDHARPQAGIPPKAKRHLITGAEMFGNQRFERDVGQNIAAVNDEWFFPKNAFDFLDTAAGFEQLWLVNKRNRKASILVTGEKSLK